MNLLVSCQCIIICAISASLISVLTALQTYAISPVQNNHTSWTNGQNMSQPRNELTAAILDHKIYAIGGEDRGAGGGQFDTVEVYDIMKSKWSDDDVARLPIPLDHTASAVYDGKIYVVGGFLKGKVPTDKLYIYDPKLNEWTEGKSLPTPIGGANNAEFINGTLYVVGGLNASDIPVNTNFAYDPKSNSWTSKSPMPTARHHLVTVAVGGKLFAIGGRILGDGVMSEDMEETLSNFDRVEMYDPQTDKWSLRQPMLTKRSGFAAAATPEGMIYVFGGEGVRQNLNSVEEYDPDNDKWTYVSPMPTARFGIRAVTFDNRIYVLGGQQFNDSKLVPLGLTEIFNTEGK